MNTYYIQEKDAEMTYIELRLLLYIDCKIKYKKIMELLNYLNRNNFIINLTTLYCENMTAEYYRETEDVMSLTIDVVNEKMRFKFWNGASTQWLYHTDDVLNALKTGREKFSALYDKYEPVTEALLNFAHNWQNSIYRISYKYQKEDFDIVYHILFTEDVKKREYTNIMLSKINNEIIMLGEDVTKDLKFKLEYDFKTSTCVPCEQAKKERESLESGAANQKSIME